MSAKTANAKTSGAGKAGWINLAVVLFVLLSWEFFFSNPTNIAKVNDTIESLTGLESNLRGFSVTAVPRPSQILSSITVTPKNGRGGPLFFWGHTQSTLAASVWGFFLGNGMAILMAVLFLYARPLERAFMPFALAIRSIPLVAITPLLLRVRYSLADMPSVQANPFLMSIFGTDQFIKMFIVILIVFFPTLVNVFQGFLSVEKAAMEYMHTLNASKWSIFWKLQAPAALPMTFAALKIGAGSAVLGVIVAEWLSSNSGLGFIMGQTTQANLKPADIWAAMFITTILALAFFYAISWLERLLIPWHESVIALEQSMKGIETGMEADAA